MLIPINPQTARPIYLQIADHIGALARSGQIGPGERLPSSRHLAEQLQVHRSTVVNAYDELRARGVIDAVHGSGSYIAAGLVDSAAAAPDATALATPDALDRERLIAQIWRLNQAAGMISLALPSRPRRPCRWRRLSGRASGRSGARAALCTATSSRRATRRCGGRSPTTSPGTASRPAPTTWW